MLTVQNTRREGNSSLRMRNLLSRDCVVPYRGCVCVGALLPASQLLCVAHALSPRRRGGYIVAHCARAVTRIPAHLPLIRQPIIHLYTRMVAFE